MLVREKLLSICIPTINRSKYLKETLDSIVTQKVFLETNQVEIVISDNASIDETQDLCNEYVLKYKNKIIYHRNEENILDLNFNKVLSLANGKFLKLNNDTLIHQHGSIDSILSNINQYIDNKPILYYSNGLIKNEKTISCNDLNSFIKITSFNSTWIGAFGIWRDDYLNFPDFNRASNLQLIQVDVLFRMISNGKNVVINNNAIFKSILPDKKGGYNIFRIFVENYLNIIENYYKKGLVNYSTLFKEKSKLMKHLIVPWYLNLLSNKSNLGFVHEKSFSIIFKKYKYHPYLFFGIIYFIVRLPYHLLKVNGK